MSGQQVSLFDLEPVAPKPSVKPPAKLASPAAKRPPATVATATKAAKGKPPKKAVNKAAKKSGRLKGAATVSKPAVAAEPEPTVKPWGKAEIQIGIILMPEGEDAGIRRAMFSIKTDGLSPVVKSRIVAPEDDVDWLLPLRGMLPDFRQMVTSEVARLAAEEAAKASAPADKPEVADAADSPEPEETDTDEPGGTDDGTD